jgi:transketolase
MNEPRNGWTIETLKEHLTELNDNSEKHGAEMLENAVQRLITRMEDADLRYQQRFSAQTEAVNAAFTAQQTATGTALAAAEKAVAAALSAADRAVSKAEMASEKRFESVNEFRASLNDFTAKLITRQEVEQALKNLTDKIDGPTGLARRVEMMSATTTSRDKAMADDREQSNWSVGILVVGVIGVIGILLSVASLLLMKH